MSVGLFLETVLLFRVNHIYQINGETSVLHNSKIDTLSYSLDTECWSGLFSFVQPSLC